MNNIRIKVNNGTKKYDFILKLPNINRFLNESKSKLIKII
jgi:hypothetical protein